jgi:hypothetical protein
MRRPVSNFTDTLVVRLGLKLSQLIDVDLKNQAKHKLLTSY